VASEAVIPYSGLPHRSEPRKDVGSTAVYSTHRLVKGRKVRHAHRRLRSRLAAYHAGDISFAELDASIQGWINHVGHADSWGLRRHILETLPICPAEHERAKTTRRERVR